MKRHDNVETAGWVGFWTGLFTGMLSITLVWVLAGPPTCHEDEVVVDGRTCVPLDDIQDAAVDLYSEALSQAGR